MVLTALATWFAWSLGAVVPITGMMGVGLPSANAWIPQGFASLIAGVACTLATSLYAIHINSRYNILRSLTALVGGMFLVMQMAIPSVMGQFYGGTLLVLLALYCSSLLFSNFDNRESQRSVFLIFLILSAATFTQVAFALYVLVFLVGCAQMRLICPRTMLAGVLGLITPPWILIGFGIVSPDELQLPETVYAWTLTLDSETIRSLIVVGFTIITGAAFAVVNILKILSYNSRVRAFNGFLTMLFIFTSIFILLNFNNYAFYLPLLNCVVAYQIAHFFTYRRYPHSCIAILMIMAVYTGLYVWALFA